MENYDQNSRIQSLESKVSRLESEIQLARSTGGNPNLGITSPNFFKRAFAVWGHYFVAQLLISIVIGLVFACISLILGGSLLSLVDSFY